MSQGHNIRIVGEAFDTIVITEIGAVPVVVILAIGFIVAMVIGHQVGKREAIVAGNQINTGRGPSAVVFE